MDLSGLQNCFKQISNILRFGNLGELNKEYNVNSSLDKVKEIDIIANNLFIDYINSMDNIVGYISEENEKIVFKDNIENKGDMNTDKYILSFDPVDGSKNILSNITSGSLYCLMKYDIINDKILNIVEAGYCLYGAKTILVTAQFFNVNLFELDKNNDFTHIKKIYKIPKGKIYHCNESNSNIYDGDIKNIIKHLKNSNYSLRYVGSIVADCHHIITNGGIFIYSNNRTYPEGKIRYFYEALPMSYIFSQIEGVGMDVNFNNILNNLNRTKLCDSNIHRRIPIILCNKIDSEYMKNILSIYNENYC